MRYTPSRYVAPDGPWQNTETLLSSRLTIRLTACTGHSLSLPLLAISSTKNLRRPRTRMARISPTRFLSSVVRLSSSSCPELRNTRVPSREPAANLPADPENSRRSQFPSISGSSYSPTVASSRVFTSLGDKVGCKARRRAATSVTKTADADVPSRTLIVGCKEPWSPIRKSDDTIPRAGAAIDTRPFPGRRRENEVRFGRTGIAGGGGESSLGA